VVAAVVGLCGPGLLLSTTMWHLLAAHREAELVKRLMLAMRYGAVAMLAAALASLARSLATGACPSPLP
jgi:chromate transport protein ChrA